MSASVRPRRADSAAPHALLLAALLVASSAHAEAYAPARRLLQLPAGRGGAGAAGCITDAQCSARCFGGGHIYINSGACSTVCICSASAGQATAVPGGSASSALGSALFSPPAQQGTFSPGLFSPGGAGGTQASDTTLSASTLDSSLPGATPPPPPGATSPPLGTLAPVATQAPTPVPQTLVQTGATGGTGSGSLGSTMAGPGAGSTAADGGTGGMLAAASGSAGSGAGGGTAGAAGAGGTSASAAAKSSQSTAAHGR